MRFKLFAGKAEACQFGLGERIQPVAQADVGFWRGADQGGEGGMQALRLVDAQGEQMRAHEASSGKLILRTLPR